MLICRTYWKGHMLTRSTSPLRNQPHENELKVPSRVVVRSGIARKSPGISLQRNESRPLCERCDRVGSRLRINSEVGTSILEIAAHDLRHPDTVLVTLSQLLTEGVGQT